MSNNEGCILFLLDQNIMTSLAHTSLGIWSPVHWACRRSSFGCLKVLASAGIQSGTVTTKTLSESWSPLDIAIFYDNKNLLSDSGERLPDYAWHDLGKIGVVHVERKILKGTFGSVVTMYRENSLNENMTKVSCGTCC